MALIYRIIFSCNLSCNFLRKPDKVGPCNTFQDEMGTELYEKLLGLKEKFQLNLDHHRFEEQCFEINKTLIEDGY